MPALLKAARWSLRKWAVEQWQEVTEGAGLEEGVEPTVVSSDHPNWG